MVLEEADVSDIVIAILGAPVVSDGGARSGGGECGLAGVEGDFGGFDPVAGRGVLMPSPAGDAHDGGDQAVPFGTKPPGGREGLDQAMLLSTMAVAVDGLGAVFGRPRGAEGFERVVKGGLVGFDLGDQGISGVSGSLKRFFDNGSRRR